MERHIKRSVIAILLVCAWALFVLCPFMAMCSEKAQADFMEDAITVKVFDGAAVGAGRTEANLKTWGTFYRGTKLLEGVDVSYDLSKGSGRAMIGVVEGESKIVTFKAGDGVSSADVDTPYFKFNDTSALNTLDECKHGFISGAGMQSWSPVDDDYDGSHMAVCSKCGAKFQVAHRLGAGGRCLDRSAAPAAYAGTYEFTNIPVGITNVGDIPAKTLRFSEDGVLETLAYSGEFSEALTFSAELMEVSS